MSPPARVGVALIAVCWLLINAYLNYRIASGPVLGSHSWCCFFLASLVMSHCRVSCREVWQHWLDSLCTTVYRTNSAFVSWLFDLVIKRYVGVVATDSLLGRSIVFTGVDSEQPNEEVFGYAPSFRVA